MEFNRRLLILSNLFPNKDNSFYGGIFVKEQVNELKKYFKEKLSSLPNHWEQKGISKIIIMIM